MRPSKHNPPARMPSSPRSRLKCTYRRVKTALGKAWRSSLRANPVASISSSPTGSVETAVARGYEYVYLFHRTRSRIVLRVVNPDPTSSSGSSTSHQRQCQRQRQPETGIGTGSRYGSSSGFGSGSGSGSGASTPSQNLIPSIIPPPGTSSGQVVRHRIPRILRAGYPLLRTGPEQGSNSASESRDSSEPLLGVAQGLTSRLGKGSSSLSNIGAPCRPGSMGSLIGQQEPNLRLELEEDEDEALLARVIQGGLHAQRRRVRMDSVLLDGVILRRP
ncbi:uncharacterized protein BJX67DRAFT_264895 [Aspergillus lucknowensis]|uniref:Uncharacterized protein n=1 Tax=Aspergillus lucknowensis TaxID=176173 RepID=A0ABR4LFE5_9EURO